MTQTTEKLYDIHRELDRWIAGQERNGDKEAVRRAKRASATLWRLYDDLSRLDGWKEDSGEEKEKYRAWAEGTGLRLE